MSFRTFAVILVCAAGSGAFAADPGAGDLDVAHADSLSPEQRDRYAEDALAEIRAAYAEMQVIGTTRPECVVNRLVMVGTLTKVASEAAASMSAYQGQGDTEKATTELRKIVVAVSVARDYINTARLCSSAEESSDQFSSTDTVSGTETEILRPFEFWFDVTSDPPEASPFM